MRICRVCLTQTIRNRACPEFRDRGGSGMSLPWESHSQYRSLNKVLEFLNTPVYAFSGLEFLSRRTENLREENFTPYTEISLHIHYLPQTHLDHHSHLALSPRYFSSPHPKCIMTTTIPEKNSECNFYCNLKKVAVVIRFHQPNRKIFNETQAHNDFWFGT